MIFARFIITEMQVLVELTDFLYFLLLLHLVSVFQLFISQLGLSVERVVSDFVIPVVGVRLFVFTVVISLVKMDSVME